MGEVHCRDPRTGIVYVYASESYWDKEAKKKKERRKLIGKMDENGNVIPTNGKPGRPKKQRENNQYQTPSFILLRRQFKDEANCLV